MINKFHALVAMEVGRVPSPGEDLCQNSHNVLTRASPQGHHLHEFRYDVDRQYEISVVFIVFLVVCHVGRIHVPLIILERCHDVSPFKLRIKA